MRQKLIKTKTVTDVISVTQQMGDSLANKYNATKDLNVAKLSLLAYKTSISGAKAQVVYKKLTGNKEKIAFLHSK